MPRTKAPPISVDKPNTRKEATAVDHLVGNKIRARRLEIRMSQETLGQHIGLTFQQIQKYEKGTNRVAMGRLQQIATALKTDLRYFISDLPAVNEKRAAGVSPQAAFMATKDGVEIIDAMIDIDSPALRRSVIDIARVLGGARL